ncbi:hypothetical protein CDD82_5289 [Ophiocordyceps australis]|uniref:Major facilitator superfamily (MFS) profile domain-containing protein n=1 Tax=Ophiocordyceps australis TaxID=1399860 RepID=A0A2C5ZS55_9HYPO|nr:hypothetical protein CDD82_5289 [Ophiocordyceps australis]
MSSTSEDCKESAPRWPRARRFFSSSRASKMASVGDNARPPTWSMGILNDKHTVEVPGSVLLLASHRNEPLGLRNLSARTSHSSMPTGFAVDVPANPDAARDQADQKTTSDGTIILDPQPEESANDPLNWPSWRRDTALLSLGFYCMIGGGITPLIAAGFTDVARDYNVSVETVSLTTGLYMMGLGLGSVLASPTAILWGKRPVYLASAIIFIATCLWAAWSPSFSSLLAARVFQGLAISPVECLPSATIAEIFFLHERAYRIGIYTLLLLGGKNLVPLISAAIIGRLGWPWVFWIVAMVVGLGFVLLFLFVPETFWDRTPTRRISKRPGMLRGISSRLTLPHGAASRRNSISRSECAASGQEQVSKAGEAPPMPGADTGASCTPIRRHVGFVDRPSVDGVDVAGQSHEHVDGSRDRRSLPDAQAAAEDGDGDGDGDVEKASLQSGAANSEAYTHTLRHMPAQTFVQQLKPYHGRLNKDKWLKVMLRPFVLFAYPAVLWAAAVYACSIGWLIVISETMAIIYRDPHSYNFSALQTGLVYVSPFVGGILGTGVAGKASDVVVRIMSRRNGGLYEPEFRLVMTLPVLLTTVMGLMGFGWSAQEQDAWIVPTLFFGILSFGCSLGSTTSITFCVDSYRQYAGEALVTLNFSKNVLHGLVFSLFVADWMATDGPRRVFMWLGIIQLLLLVTTVPLYIFGKRARMWTARKNLMEKL